MIPHTHNLFPRNIGMQIIEKCSVGAFLDFFNSLTYSFDQHTCCCKSLHSVGGGRIIIRSGNIFIPLNQLLHSFANLEKSVLYNIFIE